MKKLILSVSSLLVLSIIVFTACNKKEVIPQSQSTKDNTILTTDPPEEGTLYQMEELNHKLDGVTSSLSAVNSANVLLKPGTQKIGS